MSLEHFQNGMKDLISNEQSRRFIMKSTRERERKIVFKPQKNYNILRVQGLVQSQVSIKS